MALEQLNVELGTHGVHPLGHRGPIGEWLQNINKSLEEARDIAVKCEKLKWWYFMGKWKTSKSIIKVTNRLQRLIPELGSLPLAGPILALTNQLEIYTCARPRPLQFDIPQIVVGLDNYVGKQLRQILLNWSGSEASCHYIGVWGMGGVGKTLLMQKVFTSDEIKLHYQSFSFVWATVGRTSDIMALYKTLAQQLSLRRIVPTNEKNGKFELLTELQNRQVFLVLDDVWDRDTLDKLDIAKQPGSMTLVTSRRRDIFKPSQRVQMLHMLCLSEEESWKLFHAHAFVQSDFNVPNELEKVARLVARECKGLPLALKVIGGAMSDAIDVEIWKLQLQRLKHSQTISDDVDVQLFELLRSSYDNLDGCLKDCFSYFATYPEDYDVPTSELRAYWVGEGLVPRNGIGDPSVDAHCVLMELIKRSFIEIVGSSTGEEIHRCKIHDIMRDLIFYAAAHEETKDHIILNLPLNKQLCLSEAGQMLKCFPSNLKGHLDVHRLSMMNNLMTELPEATLIAPAMKTLLLCQNPIQSISEGFFNIGPNLRVLDLARGEIQSLPETLGNLKNLRYLNLSNCKALQTLPETFSDLKALQQLHMSRCGSLQTLPETFGDLKALQQLHLSECTKLQTLPETFGDLKALEKVNMSWCESLQSLPKTFSDLKVLQQLDMFSCASLQTLPETFGDLETLQQLDMSKCTKLQTLPETFGDLKALQQLHMYECMKLQTLPETFGELKALEKLNMSWCESLQTLPETFGDPKALQQLHMSRCRSLQTLPETFGDLKALQQLDMSRCGSLQILLETFGDLKALEKLYMSRCGSLQILPETFGDLKALQQLDMFWCESLQTLPEIFGDLKALKELNMFWCESLQTLPETFGDLKALKELRMFGCERLQTLFKTFGNHKALQ